MKKILSMLLVGTVVLGYGPARAAEGSGVYYVSFDGTAASGLFDWAGPIGPDGRGFVGLEGKVYRIEFES